MRDQFTAHVMGQVRPLVARLADDLTDRLVDFMMDRFEAELARMGEAFEVALSAFESEEQHADQDSRHDDPMPQVRRRAGRELRPDGEGALSGRVPERAPQAQDPGREPSERAARLVAPADRPLQANGKRVGVCKLCGFVGGTARGCGKSTGHATQLANTLPNIQATTTRTLPVAVAPAMFRKPPPKPDALSARRATIAALQAKRPPAPAPEPEEDNDEAERAIDARATKERWTAGRIALEKSISEARKAKGQLPTPSASFDLEHDGAETGLATVREVGPEDELDFGAAG